MSWPQLGRFVSSRLRLSTFAFVSWLFRWPLRCAPPTHSNACLEVCGEHYGIRGGHQHFLSFVLSSHKDERDREVCFGG